MPPIRRPDDRPEDEIPEAPPPGLPAPIVNLTVNIKPGKPPPGALPPAQMKQAAALEKAFLDHLEAKPEARAKFVSDPFGTLRAFSPAAKKLVDSLNLGVGGQEPMFPAGPPAKLNTVKVNLKRPRTTTPVRESKATEEPE